MDQPSISSFPPSPLIELVLPSALLIRSIPAARWEFETPFASEVMARGLGSAGMLGRVWFSEGNLGGESELGLIMPGYL